MSAILGKLERSLLLEQTTQAPGVGTALFASRSDVAGLGCIFFAALRLPISPLEVTFRWVYMQLMAVDSFGHPAKFNRMDFTIGRANLHLI